MDRFVTRKPSVEASSMSQLAEAATRDQKDRVLLDLLSSNSSGDKNNSANDWTNYSTLAQYTSRSSTSSKTYTLEDVDNITREKTKPKPFKAGNYQLYINQLMTFTVLFT